MVGTECWWEKNNFNKYHYGIYISLTFCVWLCMWNKIRKFSLFYYILVDRISSVLRPPGGILYRPWSNHSQNTTCKLKFYLRKFSNNQNQTGKGQQRNSRKERNRGEKIENRSKIVGISPTISIVAHIYVCVITYM